MRIRNRVIGLPVVALAALVLFDAMDINRSALAADAAPRPNIIVMMSDDMGYSDIGCYGSEVATPVLDSLAANGLRFTQFYNTGRCCPTRASLLTGLYPHQAGIGHMMSDKGHPGYKGDLNTNCMTMAEVMRTAGYATYMTGKWHVTKTVKPKDEAGKHNWPMQRGFDRYYGTIHGAGSFFDPNSLTRDNTLISPYADPEYKPKTYYYTDAISDHAARFINEHDKAKPFFMYVAYTAAHWPMHAKPADIAKYKGRYDGGWDKLRDERYAKMLKIGLLDPKWKMSPNVRSWESMKDKEWFATRMEVYAAMIDSMDQGIGTIVDALKKKDLFDNTLILFFQDNGGCQEEFGSRGRISPDPSKPVTLKPMQPTDLQYGMVPAVTRDGRPLRRGYGVVPGPADTYVAYGIEWANASNTPFREYKHYVHEGGISTPLIAHWPKGIKSKGELRHQPGHLIDIMATCVDLGGAKYPTEFKGQKIQALEGKSLAPAFDDNKAIEREAIYWEHEGNRAIRIGDWKLVAKGRNGKWELYNLKEDRSELNNLVEKEADRAAKMAEAWETWALRANVKPWPGGGGNRGAKLSKKKVFKLKQGDALDQSKSPAIAGKSLTVTVTVEADKPEGVIFAHGGSSLGYSLYVKDGKLLFATRHSGKITELGSGKSFPSGKSEIALDYAKNGRIVIKINGNHFLGGKVPGAMRNMPADGLEVGQDSDGAVGLYKTPNAFRGKITKFELKIK